MLFSLLLALSSFTAALQTGDPVTVQLPDGTKVEGRVVPSTPTPTLPPLGFQPPQAQSQTNTLVLPVVPVMPLTQEDQRAFLPFQQPPDQPNR